jgi:hypothetical protein
VPAASDEVLKVAFPALFNVPAPNVTVPSWKVTVPVGLPAPGATTATVAVNVTGWPKLEGLGDADTLVAVPAWFTTCVNIAEVLGAKLLSPVNAAVMLWLPTAKEDVPKIAIPELSVAVPSWVAPSLKITTPVGISEEGPAGITGAVKLTCWPNTEGFAEALSDVVVGSGFTVMLLAPLIALLVVSVTVMV